MEINKLDEIERSGTGKPRDRGSGRVLASGDGSPSIPGVPHILL
ncbi:hypothetical protein [Metallosphaera javensis (ex Sakai et al. 2022)]